MRHEIEAVTALIGHRPGTYALLLEVDFPVSTSIGRLGTFHFEPGKYTYLGSARGPGGVAARVRRHLSNKDGKRRHWHIDWFREFAQPIEVLWSYAYGSSECAWAEALDPQGIRLPARFGASDCGCAGHLLRLKPGSTWQAGIESIQVLARPVHSIRSIPRIQR